MKRAIVRMVLPLSLLVPTGLPAREVVVLLHGLCRTAKSMQPMQRALEAAGFDVLNVDYRSRAAPIEQLSEQVVGQALADCRTRGAGTVHFVAHSLGGILVRQYADRHPQAITGRVVMLGPPNQGSEVVDRLGGWRFFSLLNGPAGRQLGTTRESIPVRLGPVRFCLGVIAGNRSINWINSRIIPGPDDGKVSVERTKVAGMSDHLVVATTHPLMMRHREVIARTIDFLRHGRFRIQVPH
jgi:pimeloyl-ACP methyl ester carboxylesterase